MGGVGRRGHVKLFGLGLWVQERTSRIGGDDGDRGPCILGLEIGLEKTSAHKPQKPNKSKLQKHSLTRGKLPRQTRTHVKNHYKLNFFFPMTIGYNTDFYF